jgi:hypothetical protein
MSLNLQKRSLSQKPSHLKRKTRQNLSPQFPVIQNPSLLQNQKKLKNLKLQKNQLKKLKKVKKVQKVLNLKALQLLKKEKVQLKSLCLRKKFKTRMIYHKL